MSGGISHKQQAQQIMHSAKRLGLSLDEVLRQTQDVMPGKTTVLKIIATTYEAFKPRRNAFERYSDGEVWDHVTRKWIHHPVKEVL